MQTVVLAAKIVSQRWLVETHSRAIYEESLANLVSTVLSPDWSRGHCELHGHHVVTHLITHPGPVGITLRCSRALGLSQFMECLSKQMHIYFFRDHFHVSELIITFINL